MTKSTKTKLTTTNANAKTYIHALWLLGMSVPSERLEKERQLQLPFVFYETY